MSRAREFADLAGSVDAGGLTGRNVLINGNYDIWQRATSFTDTAGIWNYGFADRWNAHNDGTNAGTFSQSTTVPNSGSKYSLLLTGASSVTNSNLSQRIESTNLQGIRDANSLTLSGYVRSATAGKTIQFYGLAPNATDNFSSYTLLGSMFSTTTMSGNGSGGTIGIGLTDADTWYYFTATATNVNAQTNFDKGLALYISVLSQTSSSHQVYFSQLQMEAGTTASPFEQRPLGDELQRCMRFFIQSSNDGDTSQFDGANVIFGWGSPTHNATTSAASGFQFKNKMRAVPTVTLYHQDGTSGAVYRVYDGAKITGVSAANVSNQGVMQLYKSTGFNQGIGYYCSYQADAEL